MHPTIPLSAFPAASGCFAGHRLRACELVDRVEGQVDFRVAPLDLGWVSWVALSRSLHLRGPFFLCS